MSNILSNDEELKRLSIIQENAKNKIEILPLSTPDSKKPVQFEISRKIAMIGLALTILQYSYHLLTLANETHQLHKKKPLSHVTKSNDL